MLQAMNTGHEGSLSTAHANSPRHLLWRIETMALMSDVDLPVAHVRAQVTSAIDIVVHLARLRDGRRVVYRVSVVDGLFEGEPQLTDLFGFDQRQGRRGAFLATGAVPSVSDTLDQRGEPCPASLFERGEDR